jgi:hypothetical protein
MELEPIYLTKGQLIESIRNYVLPQAKSGGAAPGVLVWIRKA